MDNDDIDVNSTGANVSIRIHRAFIPVDTSSIGAGATVTAASLWLEVKYIYNDDSPSDANACIQLVGPTTQASTSEVAVGDYDACGAVDSPDTWSSCIDIGAMVQDEKEEFVFTDVTDVVVDGYTKIGARTGWDIQDVIVPNPGVSYQGARVRFYASETTGTADDPYLAVTYTAPAGGLIIFD